MTTTAATPAERLSPDAAHRIYDILVLHCGAADEPDAVIPPRTQFVRAITGDTPAPAYRFRGAIGRSGTFRAPTGEQPGYVDCAPQDRTPEAARRIAAANTRLAELHARAPIPA